MHRFFCQRSRNSSKHARTAFTVGPIQIKYTRVHSLTCTLQHDSLGKHTLSTLNTWKRAQFLSSVDLRGDNCTKKSALADATAIPTRTMPTEEQYRDYKTYEKALDPTLGCYLQEIQRFFPSSPRKVALDAYKKRNTEWPPQICTCNADHVRCFQSCFVS